MKLHLPDIELAPGFSRRRQVGGAAEDIRLAGDEAGPGGRQQMRGEVGQVHPAGIHAHIQPQGLHIEHAGSVEGAYPRELAGAGGVESDAFVRADLDHAGGVADLEDERLSRHAGPLLGLIRSAMFQRPLALRASVPDGRTNSRPLIMGTALSLERICRRLKVRMTLSALPRVPLLDLGPAAIQTLSTSTELGAVGTSKFKCSLM